jgi:hypothetical protein
MEKTDDFHGKSLLLDYDGLKRSTYRSLLNDLEEITTDGMNNTLTDLIDGKDMDLSREEFEDEEGIPISKLILKMKGKSHQYQIFLKKRSLPEEKTDQ